MVFRNHPFFCRLLRGSGVLVLLAFALPVEVLKGAPAEIIINQLTQEYDGAPKFPLISTDPPGLDLAVTIASRSQSEIVYQKVPLPIHPSYTSIGLRSLPDKAMGDVVDLGGVNRYLESVDATLVSWAKASDWPALAAENAEGFEHPISIIIYRVNSDESLTLLAQKTQQVLVPWRPAAMGDGSEYPYSGLSFSTRFDFDADRALGGKLAILVAYNTSAGGFDPIGVPGPYDALNIALDSRAPVVGGDDDPTRMLRYVTGVSKSRALGSRSPIFTVRAFPATPLLGAPRDAGGYLVTAQVTTPGFENEEKAHFQVTPLAAELTLQGLRQIADETPKPVIATTIPSGLSYDVNYGDLDGPPTERGLYPVFVTVNSPNYLGTKTATMRLGYSFSSWIAEKVSNGTIPAGQAGQQDDPDFDGVINFREYLEGSDPGMANRSNGFRLEKKGDGTGVKVRFVRNHEATDIEYQLQMTTDLANPALWRNVATPAGDPFSSLEMVESSFPFASGADSVFFRLQAGRSP